MHIARGIFMEITHLRYFKKTAELEHITKAAQELHVAQPSLSRTISMLEDELKVKLFNRKGKSTPTAFSRSWRPSTGRSTMPGKTAS